MARQTERERGLMIARKKVGYEELAVFKTNEDIEMRDIEMEEEVPMGQEDEVAAQVSVLSQLSISACAKKRPQAPRRILQATGPRRRGKSRFQSNIYTASDQVHQRVRLYDPDNMADDRRGGGGYNNRKRRYNRGIRAQKTNTTLDRRADLLLCLQMTMRVVMIADLSAEDTKMLLPVHASVANCLVSPKAP